MKAIEKIDALSVKAVHALCASLEQGLALETVYRWRAAIAAGKGVSDNRKTLLIQATAGTDHPIVWADFAPAEADCVEVAS